MKTALPSPTGPIFELDDKLMAQGIEESRQSPRGRIILPIHRQQEALVQRMLNFLQSGTYVQPHWHPRSFASETIFVMQGRIGFAVYDDGGNLLSTHDLKAGALIDIEPNIQHGLVCLESDTVILEIKRGPFDTEEDKVFASWAPSEDDGVAAAQFREELESQFS